MKFRSSILNHFGLELKEYQGPPFARAANSIEGAMSDGLMLALIGGPGSGKKTLLRHVMGRLSRGHIVVYVQVMDDTRIRVAQIIAQMIDVLTDGAEKPRRDAYGRKGQLARILGLLTGDDRQVSLVIEQAQHLHHATIRALKELRELSFLGKTEMFGIVLSGHRKLLGTLNGLKDVAQRIEMEELSEQNGWMATDGREDYLKGRFGSLLSASMRKQIAPKCKTPLQMDSLVYDKMKAVYLRGDTVFKEADFLLNLKETVEAHGISYQSIGEASGYQKATISQVLNGNYDRQETYQRVQSAIAGLIAQKASA